MSQSRRTRLTDALVRFEFAGVLAFAVIVLFSAVLGAQDPITRATNNVRLIIATVAGTYSVVTIARIGLAMQSGGGHGGMASETSLKLAGIAVATGATAIAALVF